MRTSGTIGTGGVVGAGAGVGSGTGVGAGGVGGPFLPFSVNRGTPFTSICSFVTEASVTT